MQTIFPGWWQKAKLEIQSNGMMWSTVADLKMEGATWQKNSVTFDELNDHPNDI